MTVTVRKPTLVDAVGAGMAHYQILRELFANHRLPDSFWQAHQEEDLIAYWHQQILEVSGAKIAMACQGRQIVGMALVRPAPQNDHQMGKPGRDLELSFLGLREEYFTPETMQRLFDYVLGPTTPAQIWIYRTDQRVRRFLRVNGFTLDGLSLKDQETGLEISRMTR